MSVELANFTNRIKEKRIELAADKMVKLYKKEQYPELVRALKLLVPFVRSYLCELTFSSMVNIKTKKRTRLEIEKI